MAMVALRYFHHFLSLVPLCQLPDETGWSSAWIWIDRMPWSSEICTCLCLIGRLPGHCSGFWYFEWTVPTDWISGYQYPWSQNHWSWWSCSHSQSGPRTWTFLSFSLSLCMCLATPKSSSLRDLGGLLCTLSNSPLYRPCLVFDRAHGVFYRDFNSFWAFAIRNFGPKLLHPWSSTYGYYLHLSSRG